MSSSRGSFHSSASGKPRSSSLTLALPENLIEGFDDLVRVRFVRAIARDPAGHERSPDTIGQIFLQVVRRSNIDLQRNELRLSTRKTGRTMILPLAAPLRKHITSLHFAGNSSAPIHPKAFDLVERQHKTGNLSNQFADLLAAAGLREKKNHTNTGKGRGSRRDVEPLSFHSLRRTATPILH